ncbi:MAG TPA: hypothetical protein VJN64_08130 [Terriglobales bacterium]|nr:hypothetical protein [Terriglobales bacterium]
MNPSIFGKTNELDAARAQFVTSFLKAISSLPDVASFGMRNKKRGKRKKRPKEPLYKEAREGGSLREGDAR